MNVLNLLDLPDEQFYNFCESLDNKTLSELVRTNWKAYQICNQILVKRKDVLNKELVDELIGEWASISVDDLAGFINITFVEDAGHSLFVQSDIPLLPELKQSASWWEGQISKQNLVQLRRLKSELQRHKYINTNKGLWAIEISPGEIIIRGYKDQAFDLENLSRSDLIAILNQLGMMWHPGNEDEGTLRLAIIGRLKTMGRYLTP